MAFTTLTTDLNIIAALDNEPNDVGGMSATDLKKEFDKAGNHIKTYINQTLLPALEAQTAAASIGTAPFTSTASTSFVSTNLQAAIKELQDNIDGVQAGTVLDGSITTAKLAGLAVTAEKIGELAVLTAKLADLAVTTAKLADAAVTAAKLADGAVTEGKIAATAVTEGKIGSGAVSADKLAANAVETAKIKNDAVTAAKIADGAVGTAQLATSAVTGAKTNFTGGGLSAIKLTSKVHYFTSEAARDTYITSPFAGQIVFVRH